MICLQTGELLCLIATQSVNTGDAGRTYLSMLPYFGDGFRLLKDGNEAAEVVEQIDKPVCFNGGTDPL